MLVHVGVGRLQHKDHVAGLGVGRVLRAGAGHVDDALLEADQLARCQDGRTGEHQGLALAHGLDIAQHAREHLALALDLPAGLDDVLHRHNAGLVARDGQVHVKVLAQQRVLGDEVQQLLFIDRQRAVGEAGLVSKLQRLYKKPVEL